MSTMPLDHTVFTVPCRAGKGFFLFTNGADPEFLVEDVPAAYAQLCADALNRMVDDSRGLGPRDRAHGNMAPASLRWNRCRAVR